MRFTPRTEEVERIVHVMEGDYGSGEEMAKDIIKEVADMLFFRDWFAVVSRGRAMNWGPWASRADAEGFLAKYRGVLVPNEPDQSGIIWLRPVAQPNVEYREGGGFGFCHQDDCGHPAYAHSFAGSSRGWCVVCGRTKGTPNCEKYLADPKKAKTPAKKKAKEGSS